ncbi:hypothetical protein, variant 2 [Verruconis gallopava]|uniref:UDENN domain-containing protein n=1 Tax=Verruconis gallopava TaxID=253628 RepID=A0A0D2ADQ4_9PEZI|nr:uncharacterized protein PV09_03681 [Verruconis gallopava]XP_016214997.1 hypothetical protein, variant 1 [Verruconis gallopava]XP_016214998.1 hypothetical protein, variant 2 [Verruconis gallopava]KIW05127.1 hypothetical protein PV09_03681 [Verruconis gallopava]KIW05128.1 hypothetical protein, variant 1 [Verruconis gallopava]KIW05129.1 hypothetical protein, variant 2 [Verruconis gallopava]
MAPKSASSKRQPPAPSQLAHEQSSLPLADYFFIAGIESSQIYDEKLAQTLQHAPPLEDTIQEHSVLDTTTNGQQSRSSGDGLGLSGLEGRRKSNGTARFSYERRKSIGSLVGAGSGTASNRSSATIKPSGNTDTLSNGVQLADQDSSVGAGATAVTSLSGLSDEDFDSALRKFASERDEFMEEMHFSAGTLPQMTKPKPRPRTQKIVSEDVSGLRGGVGSLRRKLSTMNSMKRQPSVMRQSSIRTSKRMSGYNSVIPNPQPFQADPNMHPLKRRYEPGLLDRYPPKAMVDELKRRNPFPDYVPMFAFPNDITVVSSDERPRSTWHGFCMTNADGSKLYGVTLIMWLPLNQKVSEELERQCEEWRKANMTNEERELASSLGERLAIERAKLSRLLSQLPTIPSGSEERDQLEDDISAVEEKIGLMTDLLRPVRHGAASKIEGLTDGETGLWIPRAYGILGRDGSLTSFWKEWLRAVAVPMTNGAIQRVPATSPKVGLWQPLERYVVNLCAEAPSPISSLTQVEVQVRELRLYARKEAVNELPGSRNVDLYALFRALSIPNIIILFEYMLAESRIILLSSHTAMLHLASQALLALLYPLKWTGILVPVLPNRLIQTLEAPVPYIVGIERRYEADLPDDDFVLVDLDSDTIESFGPPPSLPKQQRRKLTTLLQCAAPHHLRYGVEVGPPPYAKETYPCDAFSSECPSVYTHRAPSSTLATLVSLNSTSFTDVGALMASARGQVFNAFLQAKDPNSRGSDHRPATSTTSGNGRLASPPSPRLSPTSGQFQVPGTPISRNDSAFALQASLREKRSGHFDASSRRSSSFGFERMPPVRRPSQPWMGHLPTPSTSTLGSDFRSGSSYAPSVYAQSTLAASTIMPGVLMQPVRNTDSTQWVEGHCLNWKLHDKNGICAVCDEKSDEGIYKCSGCSVTAHGRCLQQITNVCPSAFRPELVRAAFVRCFASLLYTYRRFLRPAKGEQRANGMLFKFDLEGFIKSLPHDTAEYMATLQDTQAFNEFIHEVEVTKPDDPAVRLFDQIIISKRNRGRTSLFSKASTDFLSDNSEHIWRTAQANPPNARFPGDYRQVISRIPAKLDPTLMKEPRVLQGVPRVPLVKAKRKPIGSTAGVAMQKNP